MAKILAECDYFGKGLAAAAGSRRQPASLAMML